MDQRGPLRVSDQDRERLASEIREHYAAGRLTEDEMSERVAGAYRARTEAELEALRSDLPRLPPSPAQHRAELVARRGRLQRQVVQQVGGSLGVFAMCVVIWLVTGGHHGHGAFWPIWVLIFPVLTLVRNGWRLYGPDPQLDRVERELERGRQGHAPRHRRL